MPRPFLHSKVSSVNAVKLTEYNILKYCPEKVSSVDAVNLIEHYF